MFRSSGQSFFTTGSQLISEVMSASFATAAPDASAIVTLNSKNHVAHHLSATGQQDLASIVTELVD
jgi:hypothetical protein